MVGDTKKKPCIASILHFAVLSLPLYPTPWGWRREEPPGFSWGNEDRSDERRKASPKEEAEKKTGGGHPKRKQTSGATETAIAPK